MSADPKSTSVVEYRPNVRSLWVLRGWTGMFVELWQARELIYRLTYRDVAVRYRNTYLGYLWAIFVPVITVAMFTYLVSRRLLPIGDPPLPYPLFALCNVVVWQLFASTLVACTGSLVNAGTMVTRINFPKEVLVFGALGQPLVDFAIKLVIVTVAFVWYGVVPPAGAILVPFLILALLLLAIGLGCILSIVNLVARDAGNLVALFSTLGMFAAPVLYPPPVRPPFEWVNVLNPVSPLLIGIQDLLAYGKSAHSGLLLGGVLFALVVFLLGWRVFRSAIVRVAERA